MISKGKQSSVQSLMMEYLLVSFVASLMVGLFTSTHVSIQVIRVAKLVMDEAALFLRVMGVLGIMLSRSMLVRFEMHGKGGRKVLSALFSKYVLQAGIVSIAFVLDVVITLLVVSWLFMLHVIIVINIESINRLATKLACRWFKLIFVTFLSLSEQCTQVRVLSSLLAAVLMGFCLPLRLRLMLIVLTILILMILTETLVHDRMEKQRLVHELWCW